MMNGCRDDADIINTECVMIAIPTTDNDSWCVRAFCASHGLSYYDNFRPRLAVSKLPPPARCFETSAPGSPGKN